LLERQVQREGRRVAAALALDAHRDRPGDRQRLEHDRELLLLAGEQRQALRPGRVAHRDDAQLAQAGRQLLEAEVALGRGASVALDRLLVRVLGLELHVHVGDRTLVGVAHRAVEHRAHLEADQRHAGRQAARGARLGLAPPQAVARARLELLDPVRVAEQRLEAHPGRIAGVHRLPVGASASAAAAAIAGGAQAQLDLRRLDRLLGGEGQAVDRSPGNDQLELALLHVVELDRPGRRQALVSLAVEEAHHAARDEDRLAALEAASSVGLRRAAPVWALALADHLELELELGQRLLGVLVGERAVQLDRRAREVDLGLDLRAGELDRALVEDRLLRLPTGAAGRSRRRSRAARPRAPRARAQVRSRRAARAPPAPARARGARARRRPRPRRGRGV
jgi:hypothetical protein